MSIDQLLQFGLVASGEFFNLRKNKQTYKKKKKKKKNNSKYSEEPNKTEWFIFFMRVQWTTDLSKEEHLTFFPLL